LNFNGVASIPGRVPPAALRFLEKHGNQWLKCSLVTDRSLFDLALLVVKFQLDKHSLERADRFSWLFQLIADQLLAGQQVVVHESDRGNATREFRSFAVLP